MSRRRRSSTVGAVVARVDRYSIARRIDIGVGVLALLVVEEATSNIVLSSPAFGIGFISLSLAKSELFTKDFLVPVTTLVAKEANPLSLLRLWVSTLYSNLVAGWVIVAIVMAAFPSLRKTAVHTATGYIDLGTNWRAFALAVIRGMLITLMTYL